MTPAWGGPEPELVDGILVDEMDKFCKLKRFPLASELSTGFGNCLGVGARPISNRFKAAKLELEAPNTWKGGS